MVKQIENLPKLALVYDLEPVDFPNNKERRVIGDHILDVTMGGGMDLVTGFSLTPLRTKEVSIGDISIEVDKDPMYQRGVKPLVYEALERSKKIKIMGVTSKKEIRYNNFWRHWHTERTRLKKRAEIIFSDRNTDYWKFYKKLRYTKVKEILSFTPSAILLIDENIFIFSYEEDLTCIHIKSLPISDSFLQFFDGLWKVAKD